MRRLSGLLGLVLFIAPVGFRLTAAAEDAEAMRCAIACGHAPGEMKGAWCCPMSDAPGSGPVLKTCSRGADRATAPTSPVPMLRTLQTELAAPLGSRIFRAVEEGTTRLPYLRVPEKVPLLLG